MTDTTKTTVPATTNGRSHTYHAEASVLEGHLRLPLEQEIKPQAYAKLPEQGGYFHQNLENYNLGKAISIRSAHTQVAGNLDPKPGKGWTTLVTTVVEGLNVLEVLTADRVVGQIAVAHPLDGYVPSISFLGTRFDNLRIAGHPVRVKLCLGILGSPPPGDSPYTQHEDLKASVKQQYDAILAEKDVPQELQDHYNDLSKALVGSPAEVECSLVNRASGAYPGSCFGHVIKVPGFGTITLAKLRVHHEHFKTGTGIPEKTTVHLTMIDTKLGCSIEGNPQFGPMSTNGRSVP
jgi:hypothetical protein